MKDIVKTLMFFLAYICVWFILVWFYWIKLTKKHFCVWSLESFFILSHWLNIFKATEDMVVSVKLPKFWQSDGPWFPHRNPCMVVVAVVEYREVGPWKPLMFFSCKLRDNERKHSIFNWVTSVVPRYTPFPFPVWGLLFYNLCLP